MHASAVTHGNYISRRSTSTIVPLCHVRIRKRNTMKRCMTESMFYLLISHLYTKIYTLNIETDIIGKYIYQFISENDNYEDINSILTKTLNNLGLS